MPKVRLDVPDALYDQVRRHGISMSAVAQRALEDEVRRRVNLEWIKDARTRKARTRRLIDTSAVLEEVREEFGS